MLLSRRGQATNNHGSSRGTNNDGRSCRGSHSNSWGSHRSSHSYGSGPILLVPTWRGGQRHGGP